MSSQQDDSGNATTSGYGTSRKESTSGRFQITSPKESSRLRSPNGDVDYDGDYELQESLAPSGMKAISAPVFPLQEGRKTSLLAALGRPAIKIFKSGEKKKERAVRFNAGESEEMLPESADHDAESYDNAKSFRHVQTLERPPIMEFYNEDGTRMPSRPSLLELITGEKEVDDLDNLTSQKHEHVLQMDMSEMDLSRLPASANGQASPPTSAQKRSKFGWIEGVFFRCFLNIVGTMLYLRVSWVAAQAGILLGTLIVLLASVVTTITALSTCAICTNGDIKGGGAYYLISRSLGPEFGGAIGLMFSVANAVGAAMCITGFSETVRDLLREYGIQIIDGASNDVRIISIITCAVLIGIIFIGTDFESKMQMGLLVILILSLIDYYIGTFVTPLNEEQMKRGLTGYSSDTFKENLLPAFRHGYDFFAVFSIYFPATTGIMAGANISGDLKDPQRAIPLGTLLSIFVTTLVYMATVWTTGSTCLRDADGINLPQLINDTTLEVLTYMTPSVADINPEKYVPSPIQTYVVPDCAYNSSCPFGLMNYFQVMELSSLWGPLITGGIFAATLSSALASLVSAPKIFQAVCKDRLFPLIGYFEKGYGINEEPRRAYALTFVISLLMCLVGDLNLIAPIISNFYLCAYALINYACFDNSFVHSPGFRPGFRYYNMWVSLLGAILCVGVMFIISWFMALFTFFIFAIIFFYISHRKPDVNWGSSTQAHNYRNALQGVIKLEHTDEHVKNYRPQILVLTGHPAARPSLVDFFYNITKGKSLIICGHVYLCHPSNSVFTDINRQNIIVREWLKKRGLKSLYDSTANPSLQQGVQSMLQLSGLGKLRPNILAIGYKNNWTKKSLAELNDYFGVIQDAFDNNMGVAILRNSTGGFDYSDAMISEQSPVETPKSPVSLTVPGTTSEGLTGKKRAASDLPEKLKEIADEAAKHPEQSPPLKILNEYMEGEQEVQSDDYSPKRRSGSPLNAKASNQKSKAEAEMLAQVDRFQTKIKNATIDVWWLYDDGGLTLLIPYLLSQQKSYLENANLRVFTISTSVSGMEQEQANMAALLSKFRIRFSDVKVIPDIAADPKKETQEEFSELIKPWENRIVEGQEWDYEEGKITDVELRSQQNKTKRQLRIAELLKVHSSNADLIVLSLPVPRKGLVSSALYMAWLEIMTRNLPPVLLVRGNQSSVLTFYS